MKVYGLEQYEPGFLSRGWRGREGNLLPLECCLPSLQINIMYIYRMYTGNVLLRESQDTTPLLRGSTWGEIPWNSWNLEIFWNLLKSCRQKQPVLDPLPPPSILNPSQTYRQTDRQTDSQSYIDGCYDLTDEQSKSMKLALVMFDY